MDIEKWVINNLGRKAYMNFDYTDIQVMVVGYYAAGNQVIVTLISDGYKDKGFTFIDETDVILVSCPDDSTFWYAKVDTLKLEPMEFELPATKMLNALEEITQNFSQYTKATEDDRKLIGFYISKLKAKIYELK